MAVQPKRLEMMSSEDPTWIPSQHETSGSQESNSGKLSDEKQVSSSLINAEATAKAAHSPGSQGPTPPEHTRPLPNGASMVAKSPSATNPSSTPEADGSSDGERNSKSYDLHGDLNGAPVVRKACINDTSHNAICDEWKATRDTQDRLYFYNRRTREPRWQLPANAMKVAPPACY